jgi:ABC-type glutathione transport system ATPase component
VAFPPKPDPFRGRRAELRTLAAAIRSGAHPRLALVGAGGSGKSTLAAALGHLLRGDHPGGIEWFRVGAWDHHTLLDMLAIRTKVGSADRARAADASINCANTCLAAVEP